VEKYDRLSIEQPSPHFPRNNMSKQAGPKMGSERIEENKFVEDQTEDTRGICPKGVGGDADK
jgi:hypothetical protein